MNNFCIKSLKYFLFTTMNGFKISSKRKFYGLAVLLILLCKCISLKAQTTVSGLFSDNMVVQREQPIKVWGWSDEGTTINVQFAGNSETATTQNGKWEVTLPALDAGGPYTMTIQAEISMTFNNVLIGDVWVAGGQSNMEWILKNTENAQAEITAANYPDIRFFKIPPTVSNIEFEQVPGGAWKEANPLNAVVYSAVGWYFAKSNHLEKGVPVGIIDSNNGGSPAEAWMSLNAVATVPSYAADVANVTDPEKDWAAILEQNELNDVLRFEIAADIDAAIATEAHLIDFDDSDWQCVEIPNVDYIFDVVWLRKSLLLNGTEETVKLNVGKMETRGQIFFNEELIYNKTTTGVEILTIPAELINDGKNVISCRVVNPYGGRAYFGDIDNMYVEIDGNQISLEGEWKYSNTLEGEIPQVTTYRHIPSFLYNSMIKPISNFNVRGVIWYQGESNAFRADEYQQLFATLIQDWRDSWQNQNMPFLYVQLPSYQARVTEPSDHNWARIREAQTQTLVVDQTGMATTIDIGDANDIHPRNKKDVGQRLWLNAKKVSFEDDVVASGPLYLSHEFNDNEVTLSYDNLGGGLQTNDGNVPVGFAVAGADQVFYWADAQIVNEQIVISAEEVSNPVAVRYAWAVNPETNLYNVEGLPAVPFRTDNWD